MTQRLMRTMAIFLGLVSCSAWANEARQDSFALGLQVGDRAGLNASYKDLQFGLALDHFAVSVDKTFSFSDYPALYYGIGGIVSEGHDDKLGARFVFGAKHRIDEFEFFANLVPTAYIINKTHVGIEANLGFRYHF